MYTYSTFTPYSANIYSLLPCRTDEYIRVIFTDFTRGEPMGDVLFQSPHFRSSLHHLSRRSSVRSIPSLRLTSSHLVPSGLSLVGVWSINPLNAIKHTMHRRWPFKTNMHSLQTHSCPRAINVISIVYQRPLCEYYGQITLFHLVLGRVIFQRRYKKNCLMLKSSQPLESIRPVSNVGVQFRLLRSIR